MITYRNKGLKIELGRQKYLFMEDKKMNAILAKRTVDREYREVFAISRETLAEAIGESVQRIMDYEEGLLSDKNLERKYMVAVHILGNGLEYSEQVQNEMEPLLDLIDKYAEAEMELAKLMNETNVNTEPVH